MAKSNPLSDLKRVQSMKKGGGDGGTTGKKKFTRINILGTNANVVSATKNNGKTKNKIRPTSPVNPYSKPK